MQGNKFRKTENTFIDISLLTAEGSITQAGKVSTDQHKPETKCCTESFRENNVYSQTRQFLYEEIWGLFIDYIKDL